MKLPPLNALRAFEAAARHGGYIDAADELFVTRGAISRHVKLLEDHLGVTLFRRNHRGVELTTAGQRLLPVLSDAFETIARETGRLAETGADLRIICPPTLSIRWLLPRLEQFRQEHPKIRVNVTTCFYGAKGFDEDEFDLGISVEHKPGRAGNIVVQPLFPMTITPACAPALMADGALSKPEDMRNFTLLHENPNHGDWTTWVRKFNMDMIDPGSGDAFPNLDMAVKAAVIGAGIVMADVHLCREELDRGDLVLPFSQMSCSTPDGDYALIGPREKWDEPKVRAFRTWLEQVAQPDLPSGISGPLRAG